MTYGTLFLALFSAEINSKTKSSSCGHGTKAVINREKETMYFMSHQI